MRLSTVCQPITAELPLNYSDTSELFQLVKTHPQEAIIVNCQLGKGRSTLALITITLMQHWLHSNGSFEFKRAERTLPSEFGSKLSAVSTH